MYILQLICENTSYKVYVFLSPLAGCAFGVNINITLQRYYKVVYIVLYMGQVMGPLLPLQQTLMDNYY